MSIQQKVQLVSKNRIWSEIRRYKVNDVVSYEEDSYQNITGKNSIPSDLIDWIKIGGESIGVESVTGYSVDNTDPLNPIVKAVSLDGTEVDKPVTGDIVSDAKLVFIDLDGEYNTYVGFYEDNDWTGLITEKSDGTKSAFLPSYNPSIVRIDENLNQTVFSLKEDSEISISSTNVDFKGIVGSQVYDKQNDPNAFAQMGDISGMSGDFIPNTEKGQANGVATLDINGKVPLTQINDALVGSVNYQGNYNASTNTPTLPTAAGNKGKYYVVTVSGTQQGLALTNGDWIISNGTIWEKVDSNNEVTSVAGKTGSVALVSSDISDLAAILVLKANDNNVLHRTGLLTESVNGNKTFQNRLVVNGNTGDSALVLTNTNNATSGVTNLDLRGPGLNDTNSLNIFQWGDTAGTNRGKVSFINQSSSSFGSIGFGTNKIERFNIGWDGNSSFTGTVSGSNAILNTDFATLGQIKTSTVILSDLTVALNVVNESAYYGLTDSGALASLPPISGNLAKKITIANKSSGSVSIFSNDGTSSDIWNAGTATNTVSLSSGNVINLFNDGVNWVINSKN